MKKILLTLFIILTTLSNIYGALHRVKNNDKSDFINQELRFTELRAKKEINDKRNSNTKKYTSAILAAREFKFLGMIKKSNEFYSLAQEIKIDFDKREIKEALKKIDSRNPFFFNANIQELISNKLYEKAILSMNPESFKQKENESLKIIYDLLNVKLKKQNVKRLFCIDHYTKDLEATNYQAILCDYLNEYLKAGKKDATHLSYVEDYFFKNDLKERYLLDLVRDL